MHPRHARIVIATADAGQTLLSFLSRRFTYHDAAAWQLQIDADRLQVNGRSGTATCQLHAGDLVEYLIPAVPEPPVCFDYSIVYADAHLLVVNKPGNLPCHPAGKFFAHTLWARLQEEHGLAKPSFINRLDRETSGLVLVGLNPASVRHVQNQFSRHLVDKRYLVAVEGEFPAHLEARGVLERDPASSVRKKQRFRATTDDLPAAALALTSFRCLRQAAGMSWLEARPATGRLHQIRATLCSLGYPVVGDKLYGFDDTAYLRFCTDALTEHDRQRLRLPRQALHAAELKLVHPHSGQPLHLHAPLPGELAALRV